MPKLTFRNSPGRLVDISTVAATKVKNEFGAILEQTIHSGAVAITRHDTPKAVLLSFAEFESLVNERSRSLDDLHAEFDELLAHMQTPSARKGVEAALNASHAELNSATVKVDQNSCYTWSAAEFLPPPDLASTPNWAKPIMATALKLQVRQFSRPRSPRTPTTEIRETRIFREECHQQQTQGHQVIETYKHLTRTNCDVYAVGDQ